MSKVNNQMPDPVLQYQSTRVVLDRTGRLTLHSYLLVVGAWLLFMMGLSNRDEMTYLCAAVVGTFAVVDILYRKSEETVFSFDRGSKTFVVEKRHFGRVEDSTSYALDQLIKFDVEVQPSDNDLARRERVVARLRSGELIPLLGGWTSGYQRYAEWMNTELEKERARAGPDSPES